MRRSLFTITLSGLLNLDSVASNPVRSWGVHAGSNLASEWNIGKRSPLQDTCAAPVDIPTTAPKPNPFTALSGNEIDGIVEWLQDNEALGLNLTDRTNPDLSMSDNYIAHIEALKPNKTDVLSYLD